MWQRITSAISRVNKCHYILLQFPLSFGSPSCNKRNFVCLLLRANCFPAWENLVFNVSSGEAEKHRMTPDDFSLSPLFAQDVWGFSLPYYRRIKSKLGSEDRDCRWYFRGLGGRFSFQLQGRCFRTLQNRLQRRMKMLSDSSELLVLNWNIKIPEYSISVLAQIKYCMFL